MDYTINDPETGKPIKLRSLPPSTLFNIMDTIGAESKGTMLKEIIKSMVVEPKLTEENFDTELSFPAASKLLTIAGNLLAGNSFRTIFENNSG